MAGSPPGSRGQETNQCTVEDGTMCRVESPRPGPNASVAWFPGCGKAVSAELHEACGFADVPTKLTGLSAAEMKVLAWLRHYQNLIITAEADWGVDRRAIAGAIAWEALKNIQSGPHWWSQWRGPGKPHLFHWNKGNVVLDTLLPLHLPPTRTAVAEHVEAAGYLPKRTAKERADLLSKVASSITYIAAIMRAQADIVASFGYQDIYQSPARLANFYNGWDLDDIKKHFKEKEKHETQCQIRPSKSLELGNKMGKWVDLASTLAFLEEAVGKPAVPKLPPQVLKKKPLD